MCILTYGWLCIQDNRENSSCWIVRENWRKYIQIIQWNTNNTWNNQVDHVYRSMVTNISVRVYIENENL